VGHVDLDPVGAVIELFASGFAGLHRAVDDLRAFGHVEFGREVLQVVAASAGDGAGGAKQARAGDGAFAMACLISTSP